MSQTETTEDGGREPERAERGKDRTVALSAIMSARMPSVEELDRRRRERREDREARSRRDLFNPVNLEHWIALCAMAGVPCVPAEEIARASVDDLLAFDTPEGQPAAKAFFRDFEAAMKARGPNWMARWSCCAGAEIKHRLSAGKPEWHPDMVEYFTIDDPRAYDIIYEYPEATVAAFARPWARAEIIDGYPVEYRVYVADNRVIGVSNYYPQRDLSNDADRLSDVARCLDCAGRLLAAQTKPLNVPRLEAHWDVSQNHWTADFIRLSDGSIVFLEGGPPYTPNGSGHPCCFMGRPVEGIALAASSEALERMGLATRVSDEQPKAEDAKRLSPEGASAAGEAGTPGPEDAVTAAIAALEELSAKAAQGTWYAQHLQSDSGIYYDEMFITDLTGNLANEVDPDEANFIVALVNAYRSGALVPRATPTDASTPRGAGEAVERVGFEQLLRAGAVLVKEWDGAPELPEDLEHALSRFEDVLRRVDAQHASAPAPTEGATLSQAARDVMAEAASQPCISSRSTIPDRRGDWMQTFTGRRFWPLDPRPEDVCIEDIAHALSLQTRYGGHCLLFYSVAEHCVHLARAAAPEDALWLLLHDAAEAYLCDVVRPLKRSLPGYRDAEDAVAWAIYQRFGLDPSAEPRSVKTLDNRILIDEREQIMRPTGDDWNYGGATEPLCITIEGWSPRIAEREFLAAFERLDRAAARPAEGA